jgi:hypothetical protein
VIGDGRREEPAVFGRPASSAGWLDAAFSLDSARYARARLAVSARRSSSSFRILEVSC